MPYNNIILSGAKTDVFVWTHQDLSLPKRKESVRTLLVADLFLLFTVSVKLTDSALVLRDSSESVIPSESVSDRSGSSGTARRSVRASAIPSAKALWTD